MKALMIHEVEPWMLDMDLDLSEFDVITFDDGLKSQYLNYEHFARYGKPMIFFVINNPKDDREYMSWDEIEELHGLYEIGGHSYSHPDLRNMPLELQYMTVKEEAINMLNDFKQRGIEIKSFCFPFNHEALGYKTILSKFGIENFYGGERTPIEDLK